MSGLDAALTEYLAIRRALGFELREVAGCLRNFVAFLHTQGASHITTELALRWATRPAEAQPSTWAWRLSMVRRFAAWHSAVERRTDTNERSLTSTVTKRLKSFFAKQPDSPRREDSAPIPTPLFSVFSP
jgi:hypothetical protein